MKHISTPFQILVSFALCIWLTLHLAPTTLWYEYKSIEPAKPVFTPGEDLRMISNVVVNNDGLRILWNDELRCVDGNVDGVIKTVPFPGALKGNGSSVARIPWTWGKVPENTPKDVPCYIRSVQTLTLWFGIERTTVVYGQTFTISDFDYTKQQQSG